MNHQSNVWWEHFDPFRKLTEEELRSIEKSMFMRVLKKGTILRFPEMMNKYVYFLKEGIVKIAATDEEGNEIIKYLVKPGNLFGLMPLLDEQESPSDYAIAQEDSMVYFIDVESLKHWMNVHQDLRTNVYKQIGTRIKKVENRLLSMIFKEARVRINNFVIELAKEFGTIHDDYYTVKNFLTHDDIAKLTATSRQTVNSILNELRDQQLIEYNNEVIRIPFNSRLLNQDKPNEDE